MRRRFRSFKKGQWAFRFWLLPAEPTKPGLGDPLKKVPGIARIGLSEGCGNCRITVSVQELTRFDGPVQIRREAVEIRKERGGVDPIASDSTSNFDRYDSAMTICLKITVRSRVRLSRDRSGGPWTVKSPPLTDDSRHDAAWSEDSNASEL